MYAIAAPIIASIVIANRSLLRPVRYGSYDKSCQAVSYATTRITLTAIGPNETALQVPHSALYISFFDAGFVVFRYGGPVMIYCLIARNR